MKWDKVKFSISSILKKIKSIETIKKKHRDKKTILETLYQFTVFCDESYNASLHDLALFVMTYNYNSQSA